MICPPSSAGMGRMFMKARMTLRKAVSIQNVRASQAAGKMLPIVPKPPIDEAPSRVKTYFISPT